MKVGHLIWQANDDTPMSCYYDIDAAAKAPDRAAIIKRRSIQAQFQVFTSMKMRRNLCRLHKILEVKAQYNIFTGFHVSWGFDNSSFDEYFGEVDNNNQPHGHGVKIYSDGTVYVGGWRSGLQHCDGGAQWIRPNQTFYEGAWMQGMKHGRGKQTYPDGSMYTGEFAKGLEHGKGQRQMRDGSKFEGRFRFGKRDGPGTVTEKNGTVTKGNFRDKEPMYMEKPPPTIIEEVFDDEHLLQPPTLFDLALATVARLMHQNKRAMPSERLSSKLMTYIKPILTAKFLETVQPPGTDAFKVPCPTFALLQHEKIDLSGIKLSVADADSLTYLECSNTALKELKLTSNKLNSFSLDLISRQLERSTWPALHTLDLSFNSLEIGALQTMTDALKVRKGLRTLRLCGCALKPSGAQALAGLLHVDDQIETLDLAFNSVGAMGAQTLADVLRVNCTLTCLNLRSNNIGISGGSALAEAMQFNFVVQELCVADNKVGLDVISLLCGRLRGGINRVAISLRASELDLPSRYVKGRFESYRPKELPASVLGPILPETVFRPEEGQVQQGDQGYTNKVATEEAIRKGGVGDD